MLVMWLRQLDRELTMGKKLYSYTSAGDWLAWICGKLHHSPGT